MFRTGLSYVFDGSDPDEASRRVVADSVLSFGLQSLVKDASVFINFTKDTLLKDYARLLSPESLVVEIHASVDADDEVLDACRALRRDGYRIAIDGITDDMQLEPFFDVASIANVHFKGSTPRVRQAVIKQARSRQITLLAKKVETPAEFDTACAEGFSLFQGEFYCRPVIVSAKDVPPATYAALELLRSVSQPQITFGHLEQIIKNELTLSYKLLRYLNSAAIGLRQPVNSIRQALTLLGEKRLRQWASMVILHEIGAQRTPAAHLLSIARARACETIAANSRLNDQQQDCFLVGLFSLLDVIVGRPLPNLLQEMAVSDDIRAALTGEPGEVGDPYRLVVAYERAEWETVDQLAHALQIDESRIPAIIADAYTWAEEITATSV